MTNILYIYERPESNMLIDALDVKGVSYEIHNADEAKELGYKNLPLLILDGKEMNYKKAMRYAKN